MTSSFVVEERLEQRGFRLSGEDARAHAHGWRHDDLAEPVYVKASRKDGKPKAVKRFPLVLHPAAGLPLKALAALAGVTLAEAPYHNTNLRGFPRRDNGGKQEIAHGRAFQFAHEAALDAFIDRLLDHHRK